ncbi:two component transcriptional regulator, LuxR family [Geodermatophilus saharensis]|uniref:Two component transcriptional regulator, LuxR family n=1 Tax=Geodermatophilus saharensis TaxID=1137994 RepID=A0A239A6J1_9ACTN|nr:response regulator transcription factor [Geodermatophilus saharensis]SNR90513.1 two component transcriptional regulator, LuxR family [Geodermatophilus saharensis]
MIRVLVVDDQRLVREGLTALLELVDDLELVGVAEDGAQALELVADRQPDVVLMDLRMPVVDGVEATRRIRRDHPGVEVVVLTTHADDESVLAALRAGARGYLTKDAGMAEISRAVAAADAGQALLDPQVQARALQGLTTGHRPGPLTDRETEVLALIAHGLSNAEIATRLVVSEATVKTHINRIFAKTAARDRAQAVRWAYRHGVAQP